MNQEISPRVWIWLGVGVVVIAGLGLLLALLSRGPGAPSPIATSAIPTPSDEPIVASVNGRPIKHAFWMEAVLIDQVMSGLSGQPVPTPEETLQRLINEELILSAIPLEQALTAEQVEAQIATLEQAWEVSDVAVVTALEKAGLNRTVFEQTIRRLLAVQAGLETLRGQGHDITSWLDEQRASARIVINEKFESVAVPYTSSFQSPLQSPPATLTTSPIPTPTPVPATKPPPHTPALALPEVAPDFTLQRVGGGEFTLAEQLSQGPVVLVFFQRCG